MYPDHKGYFGPYGGKFVPETLIPALEEIEAALHHAMEDKTFQQELDYFNRQYVGRPSPLYLAPRLTARGGGARIYLKREDLNHTGSHKINNTLGQGLLARRMKRRRLIAETGAGQHGVATATVAAALGMECTVYMGAKDIKRQRLNVFRMKMLGAEVREVKKGSETLKDASNEAFRDYIASFDHSYYVLGSAVGPHPYPLMVRHFQSIIGRETREQCLALEGKLPHTVVACVGGGSNSIGIFHPFLADEEVRLVGVEAGGSSFRDGEHCATLGRGREGILLGTLSYLLQDDDGQVLDTHSISAGLDFPGVGPEHAFLKQQKRADYLSVTDEEALAAFMTLSELEGIIPALESAHAVACALKLAPEIGKDQILIINLSGRGDKDVETVANLMEVRH